MMRNGKWFHESVLVCEIQLASFFVVLVVAGILFACLVGCGLVLGVRSLYTASDPVTQLTPDNFQSAVISGSSVWVVEFYAPW